MYKLYIKISKRSTKVAINNTREEKYKEETIVVKQIVVR